MSKEEFFAELQQKGFRVTQLSKEDWRIYLKNKGWRRCDRTSNGEHRELWVKVGDIGISLNSAIKRQLKEEGYGTS